jgi:hypothetical protein
MTLKAFLEEKNLILKPADKNLGLTMMDLNWYKDQLKTHVGNTKFYSPVTEVKPRKIYADLERILTKHHLLGLRVPHISSSA